MAGMALRQDILDDWAAELHIPFVAWTELVIDAIYSFTLIQYIFDWIELNKYNL